VARRQAHRPRCPALRWPCPAAIPKRDTASLPCSAFARFLLSVAQNKFHRTRRMPLIGSTPRRPRLRQ
jgi:hypothetical protein